MDSASRSRSTLDLRKGDCFNVPGGDTSRETASVTIVRCSQPHHAEVSGTYEVTGFGAWPGESRLDDSAGARCQGINDAYALDPWAVPAEAETYYYIPSKRSWRFGDRVVTCAFATEKGRLRASVRTDAADLDPHQLAYLKGENAIAAVADEEPREPFDEARDVHRAWAAKMSATLRSQAGVLRAEPWPVGARRAAEARAKEYDAARVHWDRVAGAQSEMGYLDHRMRAKRSFRQATEVSVRSALGLPAEPPGAPSTGPSGPKGDDRPGEDGLQL